MPGHSVNWETAPRETIRGGMERKTFTGEGAMLALHRIQPGHELRPHSHHYEQIVYMLGGTADFHVGDEVHHLTAGGLLVIPPKRPEYGG